MYSPYQRMHRYLLMLHRASATFPTDLRESEAGMMRAYDRILRRLQRTLEACLHEALARLMCLKRRCVMEAIGAGSILLKRGCACLFMLI